MNEQESQQDQGRQDNDRETVSRTAEEMLRREQQAADAAERRFRRIVFSAGAAAVLMILALCGTFVAVAPYISLQGVAPTPVAIQITGTVSRIAGMPMPADAVVTGRTYRENGGTFVYTTRHRPQEIFNFYMFLVGQQGGWNAGAQPHITENSGVFRFYPSSVPRLTIVTVDCDADLCRVQVEY